MTDNKTPEGEKTLHASGPSKTLSVKRPETGVVRQAFSHGRSKAVVVEIKRPTVVRPGAKAEPGKPREVVIPEAITIQELANRMAERAVDIIKFLMKQGADAQDQRRDRCRYRRS
jgi:translation initiation factor IF-2